MPESADHRLQRLLDEEPFVRSLARQLVADDADEVVQQTWLQALQQGGDGVERPRSWLARITRNVAANLRRGDRRRDERQRVAAVRDLVPSSAELMQREEARRALVAAVDALPPTLRTVVLLRWFDGLPPRRIAAELGVPPATVSTRLNRALKALRERLDRSHDGDRRAWTLPLAGFAVRPTGAIPPPMPPPELSTVPGLTAAGTGVIAMTTKAKSVIAAATLVVAAGAWMLWSGDDVPESPSPSSTTATAGNLAPVEVPAPRSTAADPAPGRERDETATPTEEEPATPAPTTGALVVHVRYGDDGTLAPNVPLILRRPNSDPRVAAWRERTDANGAARFDELPPGRLDLSTHHDPGKSVDIEAGATFELDYELGIGLTVTGIVVDPDGVPVAGAIVESAPMARADVYPEVVATSDAHGRFSVRASPTHCLISARAAGYTASPVRFVFAKDGNTADVELVVGADGGCVDGLVVDADGDPVADAVVVIGHGELSGIPGGDHIPPFPALVRSDADGRFRAVGVPAGEQPVRARAADHAPWRSRIDVPANLTMPLRIELGAPATIRGIARTIDGTPVHRAQIEVGGWRDFHHNLAVTEHDGTFELGGLPAGEFTVKLQHRAHGRAEQTVQTRAGETSACELEVSRGIELVGRLVDERDEPIPQAIVECQAEHGDWYVFARTGDDGRFRASNCPDGDTLRVTARGQEFEEIRRRRVDPRAGELVLRVTTAQPHSVHVVGRVVDPDGRPIANATAIATRLDVRGGGAHEATDNDGVFTCGPLRPGTWRVLVRSPEFPEFHSDDRDLAADAHWDLGTIRLERGGTAVIEPQGTLRDAARLHVSNPERTRSWPVDDVDGVLRSASLAAGDYVVVIRGTGVAAGLRRFSIRESEETTVRVDLRAGVVQQFELDVPDGATSARGVRLRIARDGVDVARPYARIASGRPTSTTTWLAPGTYEVHARVGALQASAPFTIGDAAGPVLRLELR